MDSEKLKLASLPEFARRYPRDFTFCVAHPVPSILFILSENFVFSLFYVVKGGCPFVVRNFSFFFGTSFRHFRIRTMKEETHEKGGEPPVT